MGTLSALALKRPRLGEVFLYLLLDERLWLALPLRVLSPLFFADPLLRRGPSADQTRLKIMTSSGTVFSTKEDDLQMESIPERWVKDRF